MFGRIAAGLVHDLSHPIQNINNNCKLVLQMHDDAEYRATFASSSSASSRSQADVRGSAQPRAADPARAVPGRCRKPVAGRRRAMQAQRGTAGVTVAAEQAAGALYIEGDLFALGRVCATWC